MRSHLLEGARASLPILVSTGPLALLFGAIAVSNGLSVIEAGLMSATVFAGASQFVGIELFNHAVPAWLIVLSIFAVNFRHILYSAAISPMLERYSALQRYAAFFFLTDPQFALSLARKETGREVTFGWYIGLALTVYVFWSGLTVVGGVFGTLIGDTRKLGIDVLLPVYFMGLVLGFRRRTNFLPVIMVSAASSIAAQHLVGSPWHVSIGAFAGIVLAALLPPKTERQPAAEQTAGARGRETA